MSSASYEEMRWDEVRDKVYKVNPGFVEVVDQLKSKNDFPLFKVRYPFGSSIIDTGKFQFPLPDGSLGGLDHSGIPNRVREELGYHNGHIPLGMVLDRSVELFMRTENRVIPFNLIKAGRLVGLTFVLSPVHVWPQAWHMTSGARSIFVLPKITDIHNHRKLCRERKIKMPLARDLRTHWSLLTKMAADENFSQPWHTEILFFSKNWVDKKKNDNWLRFNYFLYKDGWAAIEYMLTKTMHDHIWDILIRELTQYEVKVSPFIIDVTKYIVMVGLGAVPGFSPAINDDEAPICGLQKDFIEHYGLKHYAPTIMIPHHFSAENKRPVYWSLAMPTHFESTVKPKTLTSTMVTLREIREMMFHFKQTMLKYSKTRDTSTEEFLNKVRFDFFHSEPDAEGQIRLSLEMPKEDSSLTFCSQKMVRRFSDVSPFVRGCVRFYAV